MSKKPEASFSAGMYSVSGRLFRSRAEALAYCHAQRIPTYRVVLVPPPKGADLAEAVKLSVSDGWTLRSYFSGSRPVLVFQRADGPAHCFSVDMTDLADLVSAFKARVRELAKAGAP